MVVVMTPLTHACTTYQYVSYLISLWYTTGRPWGALVTLSTHTPSLHSTKNKILPISLRLTCSLVPMPFSLTNVKVREGAWYTLQGC